MASEPETIIQPLRVHASNAEQASHLRLHSTLHAARQRHQDALEKYTKLEKRLQGLTDEPRWNVNIPFGPLAFMPGQIIHTNTITIHLGEDYYVEYSAKQAAGVAKRRRIDIEAAIAQYEGQLKSLDPQVSQEMGLPDGWSVNANDEVVNDEGLPICDITEVLTADQAAEQDAATKKQIRPVASVTQHQGHTSLSKYSDLLSRLEREESLEPTTPADEDGQDKLNDSPESESESSAHSDKEQEFQPKSPPPASLQPRRPSFRRPSSDGALLERPPKSVTFDLTKEQEESALSSRESSPIQPKFRPLPSKNDAADDTGPFSRPVRFNVVERPPVSPPSPPQPALPVKAEEARVAPDGSFSGQLGEDEEEEDGDLEAFSDADEDEEDYALGQGEESEEEDPDEPHIDDLLLNREIALDYHRKRFALANAIGPENAHLLDPEQQELVPADASLLPSSRSTAQQSRFRNGPIQTAALVIPSLLEQQDLKPGDILHDVPAPNSKTYTPEEEKIVEERLRRLQEGDSDIFADAPSPIVEKVERFPSAEPVVDKVDKIVPTVVKKAKAAETGKEEEAAAAPLPKKVSRFKAAQMGKSS